MLHLKACPRCGGDVKDNRDIYGEYRECLNCGYMKDMPQKRGILDVGRFESKRRKAAA